MLCGLNARLLEYRSSRIEVGIFYRDASWFDCGMVRSAMTMQGSDELMQPH